MAQLENLVFCGTPQFAVPTLEKLAEAGFNVRLVLTQPDRPKGRGLGLVASPVKQTALRLGLPVYQPEKIKQNEELQSRLEEIAPAAIIVVGYGRIIPGWMLQLPKHGNINLHASLLPKYRGAAPIQWAIANGESVTGVTTMRIDEGLDTGDILLQKELAILDEDTAETLSPRLAAIGAELMIETLRGLAEGTISPQPQKNDLSTLAPILKKEDGKIDFSRSAQEIYNRLRGFQPWPGAFTTFRGKTLNVTAAKQSSEVVPRAQLSVKDNRLFVGCGNATALELLEVQPEGKKRISARDFIHGYRPQAAETSESRATQLPMRADEYNTFESLLGRYREAITRLEQHGITTVVGSRLRTYERRLSQLVSDPRASVEAELVFAATFDLREIDEIIEIVDYFPSSLDSTTLDLLKKLASGRENPDDEVTAPAREAQYELYLGTVLRRAGIPTSHGAPDLVAHWHGQDFFIEAKRPSSPKRFDDRLRSAVHQIRKLSSPGIVAMSADQLLRPSGGLLTVEGREDLAQAVDSLLVTFILNNASVLRRRLIGEHVAAMLWTARLPARISSTGHSALGSSIRLEILSPGTPEVDFASEAVAAYIKAQNAKEAS
jgi:methionyl-tRNA formyltransferase